MKILVMGAGAVGSAIGGFLAKSGNDVTLVGSKDHMDVIQNGFLKISGIWGEHKITPLKSTDSINGIPKQDLVLLTTKASDTKQAAKDMLPIMKDRTVILSLQNGVGNEQILQKICGKNVLGGTLLIGFELVALGHVKITAFADKIKIGELDHVRSERVEKIVKLFNDSEIPTEAVDNINHHLWSKLLHNSCLNPLGALLNVNYGALKNDHTWILIQQIINEVFQVADAENVDLLWDKPGEYELFLKEKLLPTTKKHRSSMLHDLENGMKTEICFLNGKIVELGKKNNIPTPVNSMLCDLIQFRENSVSK
jgi:2-dehydropantoate 2-reductase